jgi:hypothetical protein
MHKYIYAIGCGALFLGACRTPPPPVPTMAPAATPSADAAVDNTAAEAVENSCAVPSGNPGRDVVDELLAYQHASRKMTSIEVVKAIVNLNFQRRTARTVLQKAMLFAALRGNGDLLQAQNLLTQLLKSPEPDAEPLKPLAYLLSVYYGESRRLEESVDRLNQQVHDEQRRVDELNDKLEALKNIERTLPARPGAAASVPVPTLPPGPVDATAGNH